jgi:hypothetical protein
MLRKQREYLFDKEVRVAASVAACSIIWNGTHPCSYVTITWAHHHISVQLPFPKKQEFDFDDFA